MKTLEQFIEQQERGRGATPGEANFFPFDAYLGIKKGDSGEYEVQVASEQYSHFSQIRAYSFLCDQMDFFGGLSFDINFSDNIEEQEQRFVRRMCNLVQRGSDTQITKRLMEMLPSFGRKQAQ